jgi:hypothetical protein
MIALLSSPTAMPVFDFGFPRKASDSRDAVRNHLESALRHRQLGFQAERREDGEATAAASAGDK